MRERCFKINFSERTKEHPPAMSLSVREDCIHVFLDEILRVLEAQPKDSSLLVGLPFATRILENRKSTPFGIGFCSKVTKLGEYYYIQSPLRQKKAESLIGTWVCMLQAIENVVGKLGNEMKSCHNIRQPLLFTNIAKSKNPNTPKMDGFLRLYNGLPIKQLSNLAFKSMKQAHAELATVSKKGVLSCEVQQDGFRMTCRENGTCGEVLCLKTDEHGRMFFSSKEGSITNPEQALTLLAGLATICS